MSQSESRKSSNFCKTFEFKIQVEIKIQVQDPDLYRRGPRTVVTHTPRRFEEIDVLQVQDSSSRSRLQIQDSRFKFKTQIQNSSSRFGLQIQDSS